MTNIEKLYSEVSKNGDLTNEQYAELTGISYNNVKAYISRLKKQGYFDITYPDNKRSIEVIQDYDYSNPIEVKMNSYKSEVYQEMLEIYMDDFRNASTLDDRLRLGREIRLIIEKL